ncbi:soluble epoxide hydrolase [Aaosphaeria arxii CBS 175.79]|uniref:Soluble epoxide hydrolase n=1 Tax=Aaosphaeria arxii CBS 175.79 TaxID=1450172 RepID=A0A6A5XXD7_9PLEO|nr:soluble epoxide hydrolase [Aaosphaeria arxii CBS 175.79]KAF2017822.1 soluble epoxide hydrolase [Aaosphaeria arxii CBS 175.79]
MTMPAPPASTNGSTLVYDHTGAAVRHGRARINQIRMHYYTAGSGPALLLIHGTPKTSFYWYKIAPLLTPYFTIVAPDLRGFGYTDKPPASNGYDSRTNADDLAELMTQLGHEQFYVHGEDRGAEFAFAVAGLYRDRVLKLSFCEMLLSGVSLDKWSYFTPENTQAQYEQRGVWQWHIPFLWMPNVAEMLITGKEEEFWTFFMENECYNPIAIGREAIQEFVRSSKAPGGLRGILETYRATLVNGQVNTEIKQEPLTLPIMTVGAPEFFGPLVREEMLMVANNVQRSAVFEECGHSLALEAEVRLSDMLIDFMLGQNQTANSTQS